MSSAVESAAGTVTVVRTRASGTRPGAELADPITTEVVRHALISAAEQMKIVLRRTAFSPVIYEMTDFCCALYDCDYRLLAQARSMPGFLGTLNFCVEACVERVGGASMLEPGDVLFSTNGFDIGAHSQDAATVIPGFVGGELVGYAAVKAHQMDIGGKDPYSTDTTDNFQEGTIFPGVRLYRAGALQEDMYRTILANSRMPIVLEGDLNATIVSCRVGAERLEELVGHYGRARWEPVIERMFDHGEAVIRRFLERIPDGTYVASASLDSNGVDDEPVTIEVTVDVAGGGVVVDLSRSPAEQGGPINCPLPMTVSMARLAVLTIAGAAESVNEGHLRPIEVRTLPGTMLHPRPPAPIFLYGWGAMPIPDAVQRALAAAMPGEVPAGSSGDLGAILWWGDAGAGLWGNATDHFAGHGGDAHGDGGAPLMAIPVSGMRNTPAESLELSTPLIVRRFGLAEDSSGPGRHRGGLGVHVVYELRAQTFATPIIERTAFPAWGLDGGHEGEANRLVIHYPEGADVEVGKATNLSLPAGTRIEFRSGGGGGYGPPGERDPDAVASDVREGYLSEQRARRDYPHAFADD